MRVLGDYGDELLKMCQFSSQLVAYGNKNTELDRKESTIYNSSLFFTIDHKGAFVSVHRHDFHS